MGRRRRRRRRRRRSPSDLTHGVWWSLLTPY
jgi:hypothetical protein